MQHPDWQRVRSLFDEVVHLPPPDRAHALARCDDDAVRAEVASLLAASDATGPVDELAARMASLRDVLAETPPERAGPYIVDAPIGRGGMGIVYRAHDPRLARDVALKFLPPSMATGSSDAERLIAEARTSSALDHPNICTIHDIGTLDDGRVFIAMAYYAQGTVEERLRAGPLPVGEAVAIARQVADALDCAHAAGIVHRDVKPANVAFGERGEVKVLDFGVAVLEHGAGDISTAGTPSYMSPEQARGAVVDARSDVWAVGVLLYEMLTGRKPFTGETRDEVLQHIATSEPVPIQTLRPDVPDALAAVVRRALAKDPAQRIASAARLREALSFPVQQAPSLRRRLAAAALIVIALGSAGAFIARGTGASPLPERPRVTPYDDQVQRGRERYLQGTPESVEAASLILRNAIAADSTNALAHALLAMSYARSTAPDHQHFGMSEWLDSAVVHANIAIALEPERADGHAALGVAYRWMRRHDDALAQQRRATELDPDHAIAVIETGTLYNYMGDRTRAIRWLERGVALEPTAQTPRQQLAQLYRSFQLHDEARRHLAAGRRAAPDNSSLIWESVLVEMETGNPDRAAADFTQYLPLLPPGERDRMRAWYEALRGDNEAAVMYIDRLDLARAPWYDLRMAGDAYKAVGRREAAHGLFRRTLRWLDRERAASDWVRGGLHFQYAYVYAALEEYESALAELDKWVAAGGMRAWAQDQVEPAWGELRDDPRFHEIMRVTTERYVADRAVILEALRKLRDE